MAATFVTVTELNNSGGAGVSGSVTSTASNALIALASTYYTGVVANPTLTLSGGGTWTTDGRDNQHFSGSNDDFGLGFASTPSATGGTQTITTTWGTPGTDNTSY